MRGRFSFIYTMDRGKLKLRKAQQLVQRQIIIMCGNPYSKLGMNDLKVHLINQFAATPHSINSACTSSFTPLSASADMKVAGVKAYGTSSSEKLRTQREMKIRPQI